MWHILDLALLGFIVVLCVILCTDFTAINLLMQQYW